MNLWASVLLLTLSGLPPFGEAPVECSTQYECEVEIVRPGGSVYGVADSSGSDIPLDELMRLIIEINGLDVDQRDQPRVEPGQALWVPLRRITPLETSIESSAADSSDSTNAPTPVPPPNTDPATDGSMVIQGDTMDTAVSGPPEGLDGVAGPVHAEPTKDVSPVWLPVAFGLGCLAGATIAFPLGRRRARPVVTTQDQEHASAELQPSQETSTGEPDRQLEKGRYTPPEHTARLRLGREPQPLVEAPVHRGELTSAPDLTSEQSGSMPTQFAEVVPVAHLGRIPPGYGSIPRYAVAATILNPAGYVELPDGLIVAAVAKTGLEVLPGQSVRIDGGAT